MTLQTAMGKLEALHKAACGWSSREGACGSPLGCLHWSLPGVYHLERISGPREKRLCHHTHRCATLNRRRWVHLSPPQLEMGPPFQSRLGLLIRLRTLAHLYSLVINNPRAAQSNKVGRCGPFSCTRVGIVEALPHALLQYLLLLLLLRPPEIKGEQPPHQTQLFLNNSKFICCSFNIIFTKKYNSYYYYKQGTFLLILKENRRARATGLPNRSCKATSPEVKPGGRWRTRRELSSMRASSSMTTKRIPRLC
mmetsp:Transcript_26060/g.67180  ORF Transcript_26060/g.67180 Transcript_26060/m.67180 type:complete len:252 (-) Transcript_26060:6829-7584(-)